MEETFIQTKIIPSKIIKMNFLKILLIILLSANQINAFTTGHMSATATDHGRSRMNPRALHYKYFNRKTFSKTYKPRKMQISKAVLAKLFQ